MPPYWYSTSANRENESKEDPEKHKLNTNIIAAHKPYFMTYVYPHLRKDYLSWERNCEHDVRKKFNVDSLRDLDSSADGVGEYLKYYEKGMCVGMNPCVINRICWIFEDAFPNRIGNNVDDYDFDYDILKCHVEYSRKSFNEVARIYDAYKSELESFRQKMSSSGYDGDDLRYTKELFTEKFRGECRAICPNEKELCDIILDLCYQDENMKQFAWDIVGDAIVDNLIEQKGVISFPKRGGTEFEFGGETFDMISVEANVEGDDDCIE